LSLNYLKNTSLKGNGGTVVVGHSGMYIIRIFEICTMLAKSEDSVIDFKFF